MVLCPLFRGGQCALPCYGHNRSLFNAKDNLPVGSKSSPQRLYGRGTGLRRSELEASFFHLIPGGLYCARNPGKGRAQLFSSPPPRDVHFELSAGGRKFSRIHNSDSVEAPPLPAKAICRPSGLTVRSQRPHCL